MPIQRLVAAVAAVQAAMHAENNARAEFLKERSASNQMLWTTARMQSDAAWAELWEIGHKLGGNAAGSQDARQWVKNMRQALETSTTDRGADSLQAAGGSESQRRTSRA